MKGRSQYMIKVGFFVLTLGKGGIERVINNLTNQLSSQYKITIYTFLSDTIAYDFNDKIKIIHLGMKHKKKSLNILHWRRRIHEVTQDLDVLISFGDKLNKLLIMFNKHKIPLIISERNNPKFDNRSFFSNTLDKLLYPKADKVVFQTLEVQKMFTKKIVEKSIIINNPVIKGLPQANRLSDIIFTFGRLTTQKNHHLLIRAFAIIEKEFPNYRLKIYGQGPLKNKLEKLADSLGISTKVDILGTRDNIHEEIMDYKLFILPSLFEGQSNALLESYLMGIPTIGSDTVGINTIIKNESTGLLFTNNNLDDLVNKIRFAINNYEKMIEWSKSAMLEAMKYDIKNISENWSNIIQKVWSEKEVY